jgi:5-methyltetrahydropteroyltriglutamate--homocysteine methyltransferase
VNRDVKKAVEAYWAGKLSVEELLRVAAEVRKWNWQHIQAQGIHMLIPLIHSFMHTCN